MNEPCSAMGAGTNGGQGMGLEAMANDWRRTERWCGGKMEMNNKKTTSAPSAAQMVPR